MLILMSLFLIVGIGLIGYTALQWIGMRRFMFRDPKGSQKIMLIACIGFVLLIISLFSLF
ncbi:hypothetical protein PU629_18175 [Pullulanibacillus sp. KACC 23026]|uniref:hypothetical protein n=1 Tax=Pullulanibacillus sp. KACC 23026 TaxID=3028315 RepID=UPI0023B1408F|nr:hypothetical protein [Pullulanibacillus sp. KACC 23026]WEG12029.1 hypothetical protein PU629_18175 [Pullulanibacillus sp. KACC 23026]